MAVQQPPDPELLAIRRVLRVLAHLSNEQAGRVLAYSADRFRDGRFDVFTLRGATGVTSPAFNGLGQPSYSGGQSANTKG